MLRTRTIRRRWLLRVAGPVLLAAALIVWETAGGGPPRSQTGAGAAPLPAQAGAQRLFAATSVWNSPLPGNAPLSSDSAQLIAGLTSEVSAEERAGLGPWLATSTASTPIYIAPAGEPTVRVSLDQPTLRWRATLARAFAQVPIPPGAQPARGRDGHLTVWQPSTDRLWEFFHARLGAGGWHAAWGGAIEHVSQSPGYYTSSSWPGAQTNWGATATSLPVAAGVITLAQIQSGSIDHALALDLPRPRAGVVAWPAERSDGTGGPTAIPEGAHLRLDPKLDLSSLSMPPLARLLAVAAQRYGMIVRDGAPGISLFAEDPGRYGRSSPYWGKHGIFRGLTPPQLLARFPWSHLQVLRMSLRPVPRATKFLDATP